MTTSITVLRNSAELSLASYATLRTGIEGQPYIDALQAIQMAPAEVVEFVGRYSVEGQWDDSDTGFSATLFKTRSDGSLHFAIRGTSMGVRARISSTAAPATTPISSVPRSASTASASRGAKNSASPSRALLKRPKVLIFDEATSNLDPKTAESLAQTVNKLKGTATVLFVAHQVPPGLQVDRHMSFGTPPRPPLSTTSREQR